MLLQTAEDDRAWCALLGSAPLHDAIALAQSRRPARSNAAGAAAQRAVSHDGPRLNVVADAPRFRVCADAVGGGHARILSEPCFDAAAAAFLEDFLPTGTEGEVGEVNLIVQNVATGQEQCFVFDAACFEAG